MFLNFIDDCPPFTTEQKLLFEMLETKQLIVYNGCFSQCNNYHIARSVQQMIDVQSGHRSLFPEDGQYIMDFTQLIYQLIIFRHQN